MEKRSAAHRTVRVFLFALVALLICPIRFWNLEPSIDNNWVFALNYGAAHRIDGLLWTTGPLSPLMFPQDIGDNLSRALPFQLALWLVLAAVFADLFFSSAYRLRNLAFFSAFFALSAPLYWFNYCGLENLLIAAILVLLARGGSLRFAVALLLTAIVPLLKLTAFIVAGGAVAGYVAVEFLRRSPRAWRDLAVALSVPAIGLAALLRLTLHSFAAVTAYLHGSLDLISNYSVAMSNQGDSIMLAAAGEITVCIAVLFYFAAKAHRDLGWTLPGLLLLPLFLNFKHSFVRNDIHFVNFFCFAALALGLIALLMPIERRRVGTVGLVLFAYTLIWSEYLVYHLGTVDSVLQASGIASFRSAAHALWYRDLPSLLRAETEASFPPEARFEPEIAAAAGKAPVAALGVIYDGAFLDGLNLQIYPAVQRYSAYTPYLDRLNARWVRDHGPRYLIADWESIDERQLWAETPAMWLEIYRWYNTRLLARRSLLLERRDSPRFESLQLESRFEARPAEGFSIPDSSAPVFWSMNCRMTAAGSVEKLLFRIPEILMTVDGNAPQRVIPEVLASPVMGNFLPENLSQMAALFTPGAAAHMVKKFSFGGPGIGAYAATCPVEFWTAR